MTLVVLDFVCRLVRWKGVRPALCTCGSMASIIRCTLKA